MTTFCDKRRVRFRLKICRFLKFCLAFGLTKRDFTMQSIVKAADEAIFMIKEEQYKTNLEGSIPVLVQSVSKISTEDDMIHSKNSEWFSLKLWLVAAKLASYSRGDRWPLSRRRRGVEKSLCRRCRSSWRRLSYSHKWWSQHSWCYLHKSYPKPRWKMLLLYCLLLKLMQCCLFIWLNGFVDSAADVAKSLDTIDGVVEHGLVIKTRLVFSPNDSNPTSR